MGRGEEHEGVRREAQGAAAQLGEDQPTQPLLRKADRLAQRPMRRVGRRAGGQEAAGGAAINEGAQNEEEQQLETLVVTSGAEPEKTTLLSHLLRHYN